MNKEEIYDYLDDPTKEPTDAEAREMTALLRSLETEVVPDPGQEYWNNFNAGLQTRLEASRQRKPWFLRLPVWMGALATAVLVIAFLVPMGNRSQQVETLSLASLSDADLLLISETYAPLDDEDMSLDLADSDLDLLLEAVDGDDWDEDLFEVDPNLLQSIWKEG
ncbi:MAG: hypothetical protein QNK37_06035 [Acidobacteriota bacterium]|nr:hypothetical protein [Acidobacteriota bacterium]